MAQKDIEDMLDHLRSIKSGGDLNSDKINQIETLEMELRFLRTFTKYNHVLLPDSLVGITKKAKLVVEMLHTVFDGMPVECKANLNLERLVSHLMEFVEDNTSSRFNYELNDSDLSEYLEFLNMSLNDSPRYLDKSDPLFRKGKVGFWKQLKFIHQKMKFMRYFYDTEMNGCVDHEKLKGLRTRIQFMADKVGQFCLALRLPEDVDDNIESKPPFLLCLVVLVELEMKNIFLSELKTSKLPQSKIFECMVLPPGFSHHLYNLLMYLRKQKLKGFHSDVSAQNIDVAIEFLLLFLGDESDHVIHGMMMNEVLEKAGSLVGDILCAIQRLSPSTIIKDDASEINLWSIQISEKAENLKAQLEEYYKSLTFIPSQFPTAGGLSFLDSLLRKLNEMSRSESGLDFMMKPHIVILETELLYLTSIFKDVVKVHHEDEILKDLKRRTINLAYEAEVAIDCILSRYNALLHVFCSLPTILNEIKIISVEVKGKWSDNLALKPCSMVEPSKRQPIQHSDLIYDEEIVGFHNDMKRIIQHLIQGANEVDVVTIVGMGGLGKTTCARKVYSSEIIVSNFDVRAWCIISQTYNRRELLQEIFSQVTGSKDKGDKDDILADELRRSLMGKRYLIVLDDMWDGIAWDDLRLCFPDSGNRSRIVVTTRLEKVGEHVKRYTDLYFLPFLTPEESCRLLHKKVFQKDDCPPDLQDVSQAVAKRCKGLPLVIVLVAGIIKKKKMEASWWHEVKKSLLSCLGDSEGYGLSTMKLSYDNLPDYLRPCLLYMGMFPEDARIPASKLISLWIAEGFVQNIESGRLEEAAEEYLMDLIRGNVVMVSRTRYNGKVKDCQVHDVVLHFCLEKSKEEKFMQPVMGNSSHFQPSEWNESRVSFNFTYDIFQFASPNSKPRNPFHQPLRSLITNNGGIISEWNLLRLLKVLDLSSLDMNYFSLVRLKPLIHLKYLAISADQINFHAEPYLPHLETLIVKYVISRSVLPAIFLKFEKLRHVDISDAVFDLENDKLRNFEESSKLENLRVLRKLSFRIDHADSLAVLLRRFPNLQELDIFFWDNEDSAEFSLKLESLTKLQTFRLSFQWPQIVSELHLPSNLKKLVLVSTQIESTISVIRELPCLECLQLTSSNFAQSKEWCLSDITFHKLKFLKLMSLSISRWDALEESFPQLETLVFKECYKLEEIPTSFADIPTLKQIKLINCMNKSLEASAVKIKEEVVDIEGCDRIDITIRNVFEFGNYIDYSNTVRMDGVLSKLIVVARLKSIVQIAEALQLIDKFVLIDQLFFLYAIDD
ncbi:putative late blight resistance protein -like protein R1B-14 isoform 2 [Capsicum annuum]|nr:putative late blight resistance protein -like protein R1B-14 isoform 2 [Capsicum annuum]